MADNQSEDISVLEENAKKFDPSLLDKDPSELTSEQVKVIQQNSKNVFGMSRHYKGKLDEAKPKPPTPGQAEPSKLNEPTPPADDFAETKATVERLNTAEEKRQFGHSNNLSPEETDEVFAYAKGAGIKPSEALSKPFVKSALENIRQNARASGATPGSSNRSPKVEGKTFQEMNDGERRKNFNAVVKGL